MIEPFFTMRGHTGPIFSVTGNNNLLYTGGSEGIIRVWNTPQESEVNHYGDTKNGQNYCIAQWSEIEKDREAIWDLQYHPF